MVQASTFLKVCEQLQCWNTPLNRAFNVQTNSKNVCRGDVFIALKGDRFDAYQFLKEVLPLSPAAVVVERTEKRDEEISLFAKEYPGTFFVATPSPLSFLQKLANEHRVSWGQGKKEVLGLTGSNGKTTTKEILKLLIKEILGEKLHCTDGNLNNHIGVPLTLLELEERHEFAIVEMGTNHSGEIADLCDIALPTCGLITNIGSAHIEHFKSPQNIFKEKRSLYDSIMNSNQRSFFIVNEDDEFLKSLPSDKDVKRFGRNSKDFRADFDHEKLDLDFQGDSYRIENPHLFGRHLYQNLGLAVSLSILLFPEKKETLIEQAKNLKLPSNNRGEWRTFEDKQIFLDAYNANPNSMRASLETFCHKQKQLGRGPEDLLYILGDMNELGDLSYDFHRELGTFLADLGAKNVYFIGQYATAYAEGFGADAKTFKTRDEAQDFYKKSGSHYMGIFLKASRSLQLESMTAIF